MVWKELTMQFASWVDFCNRSCTCCKEPLVGDKPQALIFEQDAGWMHQRCRDAAYRQLAGAMKLAVLSRAIAEYAYYRDAL